MYICVIITLLNLFSIYFYYKDSSNKQTIGSFIILLYAFSVFLTIFNNNETIIFTIEATLYFNLLLLLFIIPVMKFKGYKITSLTARQLQFYNVTSYIFIISGLSSIIYFLPTIIELFSSDVSLLVLRTNVVGGESYIDSTILSHFFNLASQFYPITLIFYFYSLAFLKKSKLFNVLLLLSSTSYIFNVLTVVGRDGFILWLMSYLFGYLLFKTNMNDKTRRKQKKLFYSALGIAILFLIPITVARFFYLGKEVGINSLINYSGSQFSNFNNFFNRIPNPEKYGSINNIFPIFNFDFNKNDDIFLENWKDRVWAYGIDINVFSTFIGSFYVNIGKIGTFLLGIVFFLLGSFISRDSTQVSLSKIILITLFAQIILHGLFYYKLAYTISNIYMIITILLAYNFRKT